jgi:hypothetical protein
MKRGLAALLGLLLSLDGQAHEGESHHAEPVPPLSAAALAARPRRLDDGSLLLPKAAQQLLGIRTELWQGAGSTTQTLLAEAQAQPAAAALIAAAEPGLLEPEGRWPTPGQSVHAGQILAWLLPQLTQRDTARRRAQLADLEQKLVIARLNVERLGLQSAVNPDNQAASGNIYYEQAAAEREALERQRELLADSLRERVPLRAEVSGHLSAVPARAGAVVATGQALFELADPRRLRLAALGFDPDLGARLRLAQAGATRLVYRGEEPLADAPGWRLLFEPAAGQDVPDWSPGQPVELQLEVGATAPPAAACVRAADGGVELWLHRAPERFVALGGASCAEALAALAPGERLVTQGAALLSQYR